VSLLTSREKFLFFLQSFINKSLSSSLLKYTLKHLSWLCFKSAATNSETMTPSFMMAILSQVESTSPNMWLDKRIVLPLFFCRNGYIFTVTAKNNGGL